MNAKFLDGTGHSYEGLPCTSKGGYVGADGFLTSDFPDPIARLGRLTPASPGQLQGVVRDCIVLLPVGVSFRLSMPD